MIDEDKISKREQQMLTQIQEEFDRIQKLGGGLNESDKSFIRARVDYLSESQKEFWTDLFEANEPEAPKKAPKKTAKK